MDLGYARVSTTHQDLERQLDALTALGIPTERIYADKKTGASTDRPGLAMLLNYARDGDRIVVYTLDRLARNLRDTLNLIHDLRAKGVGVRSLKDPLPVDTSDDSPLGQIAVALLALFAEMERTWNRERVAHARAVAEANGRHVGRPKLLDDEKLRYLHFLRTQDMSVKEITRKLGISKATYYRALAEAVVA